jgi:ribosomal protein L14
MVNIGTFLKVADNSGAILGLCINISKFSRHTGIFPGQSLIVNIKKNLFKKHIIKKSLIIIKGKIYKALLVRSLRGVKR